MRTALVIFGVALGYTPDLMPGRRSVKKREGEVCDVDSVLVVPLVEGGCTQRVDLGCLILDFNTRSQQFILIRIIEIVLVYIIPNSTQTDVNTAMLGTTTSQPIDRLRNCMSTPGC